MGQNRKRVLLAVDAANLFAALDPGARLNYRTLIDLAASFGDVTISAVYVPRTNGLDRERGLLVALKHLGYSRIVCRPLRQRPDGTNKSDLDTVLTMDVWEAAILHTIDAVVLASGDSDFAPLVERLVERGVEVHVVGPDRATAWEMVVTPNTFRKVSDIPDLVQTDFVEAQQG